MFGRMLFTKEGVSVTKTTLGLEIWCSLRRALLMQSNAACGALTDLQYRTQLT